MTDSSGRNASLNFTKASLIVSETRVIASMLLERVPPYVWRQKIEKENVLQARTVNTANSYATIARHRLECFDEELWKIVRDADSTAATQATLAATLKFSPLIGLFMRTALQDEYRRMSPVLERQVWETFLDDQSLSNARIASATDGTRTKLRQNAFRILTEAGYLGRNRSHPLQHVRIFPEIRNYLVGQNESDILVAMECAQ